MRGWTVEEVVGFFKSMDAEGLSRNLEQNSVNGSDLFAFQAANELQADLRVTPFAARKILDLRRQFLEGP